MFIPFSVHCRPITYVLFKFWLGEPIICFFKKLIQHKNNISTFSGNGTRRENVAKLLKTVAERPSGLLIKPPIVVIININTEMLQSLIIMSVTHREKHEGNNWPNSAPFAPPTALLGGSFLGELMRLRQRLLPSTLVTKRFVQVVVACEPAIKQQSAFLPLTARDFKTE